MNMEVFKIIVGVLAFVLGRRFWIKIVDRADEIAQRKLSKKFYERLTWILFIIIYVAIIYSIVR